MIRPAQSEDVAAIRQLVHDAYGHYVARLGKPPGPMLDNYARRIAEGQAWVLEDGGALAGVLVLENVEGGALLLENVAVAPAAQGKGYGRVLVAFAEAEAAAQMPCSTRDSYAPDNGRLRSASGVIGQGPPSSRFERSTR